MFQKGPVEQLLKRRQRRLGVKKRKQKIMYIRLLKPIFVKGKYLKAGSETSVELNDGLYLVGRKIAEKIGEVGSSQELSSQECEEVSSFQEPTSQSIEKVDLDSLSKDELLKEVKKRKLNIGYEKNKAVLKSSIERFDQYSSYSVEKLHSLYTSVRIPRPLSATDEDRPRILELLIWHEMLYEQYKVVKVKELEELVTSSQMPVKKDQKKHDLILDIIRYQFLKNSDKDELVTILGDLEIEASINESESDLIVKILDIK